MEPEPMLNLNSSVCLCPHLKYTDRV